ncbi:hypothetical protein OH76DRAFT_1476174 [Lentinus brumalis]|uniref:Uncharacterized protein n=1 Tax=Lentinus brumalis TaxID=2498619 RepID=A0A371CJM9_9APHY|nr:hypothetical protein OH76DRAFT_1476174 [Polyporus brumalis]
MDTDLWHCFPPVTTDLIPWQPAPTFRSTITIFTSCITTLFICVWSALHVNIPTGRSITGRYLSKVGWVFVGLFSPELMFYIAFKQFSVALLLTVEAQTYLPVAVDMKEGQFAQRPILPRSYRVLSKILGLTDKHIWSELPRDEGSSEGRRKRNTSTESLPLLDAPASRAKASSSSTHKATRTGSASTRVPHTRPSNGRSTPVGRKHRWTLAHGFYAVSGGFVLKDPYVPRPGDDYLPAWQKNGVLTHSGVLLLMKVEPSLIPDLAYEDLIDRGKADALAKALLVLQVSWFLITCIIRHAQGLPLCLLEITTIAHAACTLLTYFLWWHKPKDIGHQTAIVGPEARSLGAWMSVASRPTRHLLGGFLIPSLRCEMSFMGEEHGGRSTSNDARTFAETLKVWYIFDKTTVPWYYRGGPSHEDRDESKPRNVRWNLAIEATQKYPTLLSLTSREYVAPTASLQGYTRNDDYVVTNHPAAQFSGSTILLGAVYGLPHLLGFAVMFPSAIERTLWLVATVLVAATGIGMLVTSVLAGILLGIFFGLLSIIIRFDFNYGRVNDLVFVLGTVLYVLASGFIVVESVKQIFALPPAAFDLPSWGRYWPHFS